MKKRFVSLDVLRGFTVAFMCLVNNPGAWSHVFPPLRHASWAGCTPTDLVFPLFVFCSGCAMAFSFRKYPVADAKAYWHVVKRACLIFLVGFLLNLYPFFPTSLHDPSWSFGQNYMYWLGHRRIFGVLQRIGMAYLIAGCLALWLKKPGKIGVAVAALCVAYTGILLAFGREPGAFTLEGNVSVRIDEWLVGADHCYHGYGGTNFDPEGLLGSLTTACTMLLGYLIGHMIVNAQKMRSLGEQGDTSVDMASFGTDRVVNRTFVYGCLSLAFAMVLSVWIPICKPLWSASYVFFAAGWGMLLLAFLAYFIDVRGIEKPFEPFKAMGMNALSAFVLAGLLAKTLPLLGFHASEYFGANEYMSLLYAVIFVFVIFCVQWLLYKKKIVIKL